MRLVYGPEGKVEECQGLGALNVQGSCDCAVSQSRVVAWLPHPCVPGLL